MNSDAASITAIVLCIVIAVVFTFFDWRRDQGLLRRRRYDPPIYYRRSGVVSLTS